MNKGRKHLSLRLQMAIIAIACTLVAGIAAFVVTELSTQNEAAQLHDHNMREVAALLMGLSVHELAELPEDASVEARVAMGRADAEPNFTSRYRYQIWDLKGKFLLGNYAADDRLPIGAVSAGGLQWITMDGEPWRFLGWRNDNFQVQILLAEHVSARAFKDSVRDTFWLLVLPSLVMVLAPALWALSFALKPLEELHRDLEGRSASDLREVVLSRAPAELMPVQSALNRLFGRVLAMFHREKGFTALAAHEMRTPLANMRVVAETALRTSDSKARDQALTDLIGCVDQIGHLQDQLLTLARIESSDLNKFREPFALVEVVDDAVADLLPEITAKKLKLKLALDSTAIFGHRFAVLTMIRNLLANSVRHTPEGGVIRVSTSGLGPDATLLVEDSGPGIPEEHRARALERFERLNAHSGPGSGLGLSIVCAVADLHGAKLDLDASELGGLLVRVLFAGRAHQGLDDLPSNDFSTPLTTTAIS